MYLEISNIAAAIGKNPYEPVELIYLTIINNNLFYILLLTNNKNIIIYFLVNYLILIL